MPRLLLPIRLPLPSSFLESTRSLTIHSSRRLTNTNATRRSPVVGVQEVVKEKKASNSLLIMKEEGLELYKDMILGRSFEDMCAQMYYRGIFFGFVHLYNGQEAVSTGFINLLTNSHVLINDSQFQYQTNPSLNQLHLLRTMKAGCNIDPVNYFANDNVVPMIRHNSKRGRDIKQRHVTSFCHSLREECEQEASRKLLAFRSSSPEFVFMLLKS